MKQYQNGLLKIFRHSFTCLIFLGFCTLLGAACTGKPTSESMSPTQRPPLRELASLRGKFIGSAVQAKLLETPSAYTETIQKQFNIITPENELKFDWIHPSALKFSFEAGDRIVQFAKTSNINVRGHTLVWHRALPPWVTQSNLTSDELEKILREHIFTVIRHYSEKYPGQIISWDVVNEALDDRNEIRKDSPWSKIGPDPDSFIVKAFQWAHEADPHVKLFYNDYADHDLGPRADAVYRLVKRLLAKGVPIHGIGWQMHLDPRYPFRSADVRRNFERFARLGLEIHMTEFDYPLPLDSSTNLKSLALQNELYEQTANLCAHETACKAFVTWGFTDLHSWIDREQPGWGVAHYFDKNYRPKKAFFALMDGFEK